MSRKTKTCPICGRGTVQKYRPFCSRRCADRDLGNWASGAYAIPTDERVPNADDGETGKD